jgi:hypothetical protein
LRHLALVDETGLSNMHLVAFKPGA